MLGDEPLAGEDPWVRARRIQQAARAHTLAGATGPRWPEPCAPLMEAMSEAAHGAWDEGSRFELALPLHTKDGTFSSHLWAPSRSDWAKLWADAGRLTRNPQPREVPKPPRPEAPLRVGDLKPLAPADWEVTHSRVIGSRMLLRFHRSLCVLEGERTTCRDYRELFARTAAYLPDLGERAPLRFLSGGLIDGEGRRLASTAPSSSDAWVFDDGTTAMAVDHALHVFDPAGKVLFEEKHRAGWYPVVRGDALIWTDDGGLVVRDLLATAPYLAPPVRLAPFHGLYGATCRTADALFFQSGSLVARTGKGWRLLGPVVGDLTCSGAQAIVTRVSREATTPRDSFGVRAVRCDAGAACREESGHVPDAGDGPYLPTEKPRVGPIVRGVGASLAVIDDRDGLWVRVASNASALATTAPRLVLDDGNEGTEVARLIDVVPIVGGLVLLVESRMSYYGVFVRPDGSFAALSPAP